MLLARKGYRVLLLDKASFPSDVISEAKASPSLPIDLPAALMTLQRVADNPVPSGGRALAGHEHADHSHAAGILALRNATFGDVDPHRLRPEVWRWQFVDNPAGPGWIRLADHDGRPQIHVVNPRDHFHAPTLSTSRQRVMEELIAKAGGDLEQIVGRHRAAPVPIDYEVRVGKPSIELILAGRAWHV